MMWNSTACCPGSLRYCWCSPTGRPSGMHMMQPAEPILVSTRARRCVVRWHSVRSLSRAFHDSPRHEISNGPDERTRRLGTPARPLSLAGTAGYALLCRLAVLEIRFPENLGLEHDARSVPDRVSRASATPAARGRDRGV